LGIIAYSQDLSTISGFVRDDATGEPISYANIFLANTSLGAASSQEGYYVITKIPLGSYEINASMIGYGIYKEQIIVSARETVRLDIRLTEQAIEASEILVTAERIKFEKSMESSQISLDLREINSAPAFVEPDVFRTLQMLPGVQTTSDFSSALYVRGSTPEQNLIMLDGIAIYNPYHLGGIFSTFNTDAIKEADFHAGGFPARYGGRMGAILNVINREGNTQKVTGSANLSLISSKVLLEGPIPEWKGIKGSWMISGRRTYFDKVIDALMIPTGAQKSDGSDIYFDFPYYFYDYQVKVNLDLNPDHRLTYSRFYGDDVLDFSFNDIQQTSDSNVNIKSEFDFNINWPWGNHTNGLTWRWIVSPTVVAKTFYANSRYRFDFDISFHDRTTYTYPAYSDSTLISETNFTFEFYDIIKDNTVETEITWKARDNQVVTGGFQVKDVNFDLGMEIGISTLDTAVYDTPLALNNNTREIAFFIQDKWDISEKLKFQGGIRVTDYNLHDRIYLDPRLGIKYHYSDNIAFKLNWGHYHQFLTTANGQDENLRLVEMWMGIPEDKPASFSQHTIAGVEYLAPNNIFYRVEVYRKDFDNLLTLKQGDVTTENEGEIESTPFNEFWDTDAKSQGVEFLLKKSTGRFNGWIGYTFAKTEYYTPPSGWHPPNFDRTHTLNVVGNIELTPDLEISSALTSSTGNPYTPILGRVYDWGHILNSSTYWYPYDSYLVGDKNTVRYDNYFRVDIGITRKRGNLFGLEYDTFWQIMNVTRNLNMMGYIYRTKTDLITGNRMGVERRPVPMFPLILTFGIKFEF
tara:strand:- start:1135 stop:3552 length:2418 start_codon:yes stop_codon:yes gene_type:complete